MALYYTFAFFILNSLCNQNFLNCNTGENLFFQYTSISFNLSILTSFMLIMLSTKNNITAAIIVLVALLQQTNIRADYFINTSLVNVGLLNPLSQYHPPIFFTAVFIFTYKLISGNKRYLSLPTNSLLISLLLSGW